MIEKVILDSDPLGKLAHSRRHVEIAAWFDGLLPSGFEVYLPEIADYEVRRELLLAGLSQS